MWKKGITRERMKNKMIINRKEINIVIKRWNSGRKEEMRIIEIKEEGNRCR